MGWSLLTAMIFCTASFVALAYFVKREKAESSVAVSERKDKSAEEGKEDVEMLDLEGYDDAGLLSSETVLSDELML